MECVVSPLYGKDNNKNLIFECNYCGKKMGYNEKRKCKAKFEKCNKCGSLLGNSDYSLNTCLNCNQALTKK